MKKSITWAGLDAHKKFISVAIIIGRELVEEFEVENNKSSVNKLCRRLKKIANASKQASGEIRCCYEAGPLGFGLKRQFENDGQIVCEVVAPSLIPVKPGERIKTDRRDAKKLAELLSADLLTEVHAPTEEEEAVRDLCRCRDDLKSCLVSARHRLAKFLLRRPEFQYGQGKRSWTRTHIDWLRRLKFKHAADQDSFDEYLFLVEHLEGRLRAVDEKIDQASKREPFKQAVAWLRCFHGIDTVGATTIVSNIHDFRRFDSARKLMSYLGLTPSEHSSGDQQRRGSITKNGNKHVRRILVEAAWHYRHRPNVGQKLEKRRAGQPNQVVGMAHRAHLRLSRRYRKMQARGKNNNKIVTAVARELAGFVWAMMNLRAA